MTNITGNPTALSTEYAGFASAFSFVILANLLGNSLVVLVILKDRASRTVMNYLLMNLAFADMAVAIFMAIKFVVSPTFRHPAATTGRLLCKLITGGTTAWTASVASIYNLVAIALECYYACFQSHKRRGKRRIYSVKKTVIVIWLIAIIWGLPLYLSVTYVDDLMTCAEQWPSLTLPKLYSLGWIFVGGVVPISIMTVLYFKVVRFLWFAQGPLLSPAQVTVLHSRRRVTTMVLGVSAIYVICWTPTLIIYFLVNVRSSEDMYSVVHKISILLATINSSVNPVIYSLRSSRFRKNLHRVICCTRRPPPKRRIIPMYQIYLK